MPTQTVQLLAKASHANGATTSPTVTLPAGILAARFWVDSSVAGVKQYSLATQHINFQAQIDRGDGAGFVPDCGFTSHGGYHDRHGVATDPECTCTISPSDAGAAYRGQITVSGGPIQFGFNVDILT